MSMFNIGGTSNNANAAPVGAKKLDFDIDNDDFFNSFEPSKPVVEETKPNPEKSNGTNKFVSKLQEVNDPFEIAPSVSNGNKP